MQDEDNILPPDDEDGCLENEEEYDALNDETFGDLVDESSLDDWEQQHEQFAEIAESSRLSEHIGKIGVQYYIAFNYYMLVLRFIMYIFNILK